jgi:hypothetical protein
VLLVLFLVTAALARKAWGLRSSGGYPRGSLRVAVLGTVVFVEALDIVTAILYSLRKTPH